MEKCYDTSMGDAIGSFPRTEWTKMLNPSQRDALLAELCQNYWKPLYCYLRGRGFGNEQAKDLVQEFFTEKVLGQELIEKADRTKGRFRTFLLIAIRNYAINFMKKEGALKIPTQSVGNIERQVSPEAEFNRAWAEELLNDILAELETECHRKGKDVHWLLFHEWLLEPHIDGDQRRLSDICARNGITDPAQGHNMITNIKKRFRTIMRNRLRSLVDSDEQVDVEIADFLNAFSN